MHWENLIIGFIVLMGIVMIIFKKLKIHPSHFPDTQTKKDSANNKPKI